VSADDTTTCAACLIDLRADHLMSGKPCQVSGQVHLQYARMQANSNDLIIDTS
jgi:hypothetical protein